MKKADAIKKFEVGGRLMLAEYRSSKGETIHYRDGKTGQRASFESLRHVVEVGLDSVIVQERVAEGKAAAESIPNLSKGVRVVVFFDSVHTERGQTIVQGRIEPLTD